MKEIKYKVETINDGKRVLEDKSIICEEKYLESNIEVAKKEAYNGKIDDIVDNEEFEVISEPTDAERIAELEEALALLLSGDTR